MTQVEQMVGQQDRGGLPRMQSVKTGELLGEVLVYGKGNWRSVLKLATIPFLLSLGLAIGPQALSSDISILEMLAPILSYVPMAVFAVALHRRYLLDRKTAIAFGYREVRFIGYVFLVTVLPMAAIFAPMFVLATTDQMGLSLLWIIPALIVVYICLRLILMFPIAAVDYPGRVIDHLGVSWSAMNYGIGAMFGAAIIVSVVLGIFFASIGFAVTTSMQGDGMQSFKFIFFGLAGVFEQYVYQTFFVIMASFTFRKLVLSPAKQET